MPHLVAGQRRSSGDFTRLVYNSNAAKVVEATRNGKRPAKTTQVLHRAIFPEEGVNRRDAGSIIRCCVGDRKAQRFARSRSLPRQQHRYHLASRDLA